MKREELENKKREEKIKRTMKRKGNNNKRSNSHKRKRSTRKGGFVKRAFNKFKGAVQSTGESLNKAKIASICSSRVGNSFPVTPHKRFNKINTSSDVLSLRISASSWFNIFSIFFAALGE